MSAPTTKLSGNAGTISTSGESNGILVDLPKRNHPGFLMVGVYGTFVSLVLAVKGKLSNGSTYYALFGCTPAGTPVSDSTALAPSDSTATRWFLDVTGLDPEGGAEIYAVSGTLTAVNIEAVEVAGPLPVVINTTLSNQLAVATAGAINDANGAALLKFPSAVSSAVNQVTLSNAAAGSNPTLAPTGTDTNISLGMAAKGTGAIRAGVLTDKRTVTAVTDTATITIAQLMTKIIQGTPTAAATYTLPTAALAVGGIANAAVGDSFDFIIDNRSAGANTITVAAGANGTAKGTLTVAQNVVRSFKLQLTNVTGSSETYNLYGLG